MSHQKQDIRLRPDGSIDTAYYMSRGRKRRSETAHTLFRRNLSPGTAGS